MKRVVKILVISIFSLALAGQGMCLSIEKLKNANKTQSVMLKSLKKVSSLKANTVKKGSSLKRSAVKKEDTVKDVIKKAPEKRTNTALNHNQKQNKSKEETAEEVFGTLGPDQPVEPDKQGINSEQIQGILENVDKEEVAEEAFGTMNEPDQLVEPDKGEIDPEQMTGLITQFDEAGGIIDGDNFTNPTGYDEEGGLIEIDDPTNPVDDEGNIIGPIGPGFPFPEDGEIIGEIVLPFIPPDNPDDYPTALSAYTLRDWGPDEAAETVSKMDPETAGAVLSDPNMGEENAAEIVASDNMTAETGADALSNMTAEEAAAILGAEKTVEFPVYTDDIPVISSYKEFHSGDGSLIGPGETMIINTPIVSVEKREEILANMDPEFAEQVRAVMDFTEMPVETALTPFFDDGPIYFDSSLAPLDTGKSETLPLSERLKKTKEETVHVR